MAVFPKISFMTSRDRKCVGESGNGDMQFAHCWQLFYSLHEVSSSKTNLENAFFHDIHECNHL